MDYITLQIDYINGNRQTWDYEVAQYKDIDALKADMAGDFAELVPQVKTVTIKYGKNVQLTPINKKGDKFVDFVFGKIK